MVRTELRHSGLFRCLDDGPARGLACPLANLDGVDQWDAQMATRLARRFLESDDVHPELSRPSAEAARPGSGRCTVTGESDARISRGAPRSGCTVVSASGVRPHRGCDGADGYQTVLTLLTQGPPSPGLVVALGVRASPTASVQAIRSDGPRRHPRRRDHHLSHQDREADQSGE